MCGFSSIIRCFTARVDIAEALSTDTRNRPRGNTRLDITRRGIALRATSHYYPASENASATVKRHSKTLVCCRPAFLSTRTISHTTEMFSFKLTSLLAAVALALVAQAIPQGEHTCLQECAESALQFGKPACFDLSDEQCIACGDEGYETALNSCLQADCTVPPVLTCNA
ncbi:hypothetical protein BDW22DRAFT_1193344 [Trametopsis cervina]|nr:hypothetical protein BDW22DRAFT_1193344 [Trametopsis cervina]